MDPELGNTVQRGISDNIEQPCSGLICSAKGDLPNSTPLYHGIVLLVYWRIDFAVCYLIQISKCTGESNLGLYTFSGLAKEIQLHCRKGVTLNGPST